MRTLSASELLDIWERGLTQPPIQRALMLLAAACPKMSADALAELSIGKRDARLLTLRERTFGPELVSVMACPSCGDRLELTFNVTDIQGLSETEPNEALSLTVADYEVSFHLPNSRDLAAVSPSEEVAESRRLLLQQCLLTIRHNGEEVSDKELPADIIEAIVQRMAQADPQGDVYLSLVCPACKHHWQAPFDIVTFFWTEIDAWAHRILREVHTLASAYSWREADIFAMSPSRRQFYLTMVSG